MHFFSEEYNPWKTKSMCISSREHILNIFRVAITTIVLSSSLILIDALLGASSFN